MTTGGPAAATPRVSVIIPARNAGATIGAQLEALARQEANIPWEVVLVDNASTDDTVAVASNYEARLPTLRIVGATAGNGPGYARNVGAEAARGEALLFCDAYDVVAAGWLNAHLDALESFDAVGGPVDEEALNARATRRIRHPLVGDELPTAFGFSRAPAGNLAVRREVFESLGGFDETYLVSQDTEFSLRLQVNGYRLGFTNQAEVMYRHGDGLSTNLRKLYRWNVTRPRLYAQYREHGATRSVLRGLGKWPWLVVCSFYLLAGQERRWQWLARAVASWARLVGSVKYRAFVP
jgi:glycosyltransferase involved in cell wall biosynthesis